MIEVEFGYSELIDSVIERLQYISGKRAGNTDEYFRHAACSADSSMLMQLAAECISFLALKVGKRWVSTVISGDLVKITFNSEAETAGILGDRDTFSRLVRTSVVYAVISRWLSISGSEDASLWESRADYLYENLLVRLNIRKSLKPRRIPF